MDDIDGEFFTVRQLREWLRHLNLPTNGNKAALVLRLNAVPIAERGECPIPDDENAGGEVAENAQREVELLRRELALAERQRSVLEMEVQLLRQRNLVPPSSTAPSPREVPEFNLSTIKYLLPEYDGKSSVELWVSQLQNLSRNYELRDDVMRALLVCKVKGSAQSWLHAKVDYMSTDVHTLLRELTGAFKTPSSKLMQRRKFESRKWSPGERFAEYFNEKIKLSAGLQFEETELVEHMIEGIGNYQLRTQATIQCFPGPDDLLRAFANVELPKASTSKPAVSAQTKDDKVRCYNCNSLGHFASDCRKPKRELGSCYGCGSREHLLPSCPQRKGVHVIEEIREAQ